MKKLKTILRDFWWPFGNVGEQSIEGQPEHLHESIRMKNRWNSHRYFPFMIRWAVLTGVAGLSLDLVAKMEQTLFAYILWMFMWSLFVIGSAITAFLVWLYSMKPK